jgi:hypothetical protein
MPVAEPVDQLRIRLSLERGQDGGVVFAGDRERGQLGEYRCSIIAVSESE